MQGPEITLDKVLNSKVYVTENSQISFGSPRQFIEPFLEKFTRANLNVTFKTNVSQRVANKEAEGDVVNEAFGRVVVEAKLPAQYTVHAHDSVIGMVYSLDTLKPVIKVYSGQNAWACTNLAIFGARYVHEIQILSGYNGAYEKAFEYIDGVTAQLARFQQIYEAMNDTVLNNEQINEFIGKLLRECNRNKAIGTTPIMSAVKDLDDPKSKYAIQHGHTSQWNIYSAITQYVTDKVDILEKATKTSLISNLFVPSL